MLQVMSILNPIQSIGSKNKNEQEILLKKHIQIDKANVTSFIMINLLEK
jgi:hypothetical protein